TSPPVIVRDVIVVGSSVLGYPVHAAMPVGDVRGYDVRTGQRLWTFRAVPGPGEVGHETWENDSWKTIGNTNVWTLMSADEELGYVYLPFSPPANDYYGGHRHGDNLFSDALVCLDARTGKRIWHYQITRHDIWDYDLPAAPNLMDVTVDGRRVKAVAQVTKRGHIFAFDRVTGTPLWPIEDRAVPQSTVPGEKTAATQPFPTRPAPVEIQGLRDDDLIDLTPDLRRSARAIVSRYDNGPLYTPPSERGTILVPGGTPRRGCTTSQQCACRSSSRCGSRCPGRALIGTLARSRTSPARGVFHSSSLPGAAWSRSTCRPVSTAGARRSGPASPSPAPRR